MRLIDDLLNDDHYDEQPAAQEPQSISNSPSPVEDVPDGSGLNANGRRGRSNSVSDDPEELRRARRTWMEATMDELTIRGTDREHGRHFADVSTPRSTVLRTTYIYCAYSSSLLIKLCTCSHISWHNVRRLTTLQPLSFYEATSMRYVTLYSLSSFAKLQPESCRKPFESRCTPSRLMQLCHTI